MIAFARRESDRNPTLYQPPVYTVVAHSMTRRDINRTRRIVCVHIVGSYPNGLQQNEVVVGLTPVGATVAAMRLAREALLAYLLPWRN